MGPSGPEGREREGSLTGKEEQLLFAIHGSSPRFLDQQQAAKAKSQMGGRGGRKTHLVLGQADNVLSNFFSKLFMTLTTPAS